MKKAGELLQSYFDSETMNSARTYSAFFSSWKKIVDERLAAHSRIVELEGTVLVVEADHPGWIQLIQLKRSEILNAVRKMFPDLTVTAISIKLKKDGFDTPARRPPEPRETEPETADDAGSRDGGGPESPSSSGGPGAEAGSPDPYGNIRDDAFKDLLKRLESSIAERNRGKGSR